VCCAAQEIARGAAIEHCVRGIQARSGFFGVRLSLKDFWGNSKNSDKEEI
jgi:hypothetical protein